MIKRRKLLHCMHQQQNEEAADVKGSYQWLEKAGLKDSKEALIREQAQSIRAVEAGVYHWTCPQVLAVEKGL